MLMRTDRFPTLWNNRTAEPVHFSSWLDDLFDDAFNWSSGTFVPELNVSETDTTFEVTLALPGMNKEDIDISLEGNTLVISGERKIEQEENGRKFHRIESRFGSFRRTLPLPDIIDAENVQATYENGVLTVAIPKLEEKARKKIELS